VIAGCGAPGAGVEISAGCGDGDGGTAGVTGVDAGGDFAGTIGSGWTWAGRTVGATRFWGRAIAGAGDGAAALAT
jgi:hypothetical protein